MLDQCTMLNRLQPSRAYTARLIVTVVTQGEPVSGLRVAVGFQESAERG
jgi:hypothetical protein